jgi:hypothetical protein
MITAILTTRHQHQGQTRAEHRATHEAFIARQQAQGLPVTVSDRHAPIQACINHGRWVALCDCGAGMAIDPDWPEARCFGCGTVHHVIVVPADRATIETVLLARPPQHRHWAPTETVDDLRAENRRHGVMV